LKNKINNSISKKNNSIKSKQKKGISDPMINSNKNKKMQRKPIQKKNQKKFCLLKMKIKLR
jgi:hypothetical protein